MKFRFKQSLPLRKNLTRGWHLVAPGLISVLWLAGCSASPVGKESPPALLVVKKVWVAKVSLNPSGKAAQFLGQFETEAACNAAVQNWQSRQVVGNTLYGVCEVRSN